MQKGSGNLTPQHRKRTPESVQALTEQKERQMVDFLDLPLPGSEVMNEGDLDSGDNKTSPVRKDDASVGVEGGESPDMDGDMSLDEKLACSKTQDVPVQGAGAEIPATSNVHLSSDPIIPMASTPKPSTKAKPKYTCTAPGCGKRYLKSRFSTETHCSDHSIKRMGKMVIPQQKGQPPTHAQRKGIQYLHHPVNAPRPTLRAAAEPPPACFTEAQKTNYLHHQANATRYC